MRKLHFSLRCCTTVLLLLYTDVDSIRTDHAAVRTERKFFSTEKTMKTPMHKVQMTQRGYIQVKINFLLRINRLQ